MTFAAEIVADLEQLAELRRDDASVGLAGLSAIELARDYARAEGARRTLGFAAVNAITRHLYDRAGFVPPAASGSVGDLDLQRGDHLGMVGLFPSLIERVRATGAALTVLELRADLAGCNKILSTSTVLLNQSLSGLLAHWQRAERIALAPAAYPGWPALLQQAVARAQAKGVA